MNFFGKNTIIIVLMVILAIYYMNKNNKKTLEKFQGGVFNPLFASTPVGRLKKGRCSNTAWNFNNCSDPLHKTIMHQHCKNQCKEADNRCDEAARNIWGAKYTGLSGRKLNLEKRIRNVCDKRRGHYDTNKGIPSFDSVFNRNGRNMGNDCPNTPCAQNAASKFACTNAWNWNERLNKAELKQGYNDYDNVERCSGSCKKYCEYRVKYKDNDLDLDVIGQKKTKICDWLLKNNKFQKSCTKKTKKMNDFNCGNKTDKRRNCNYWAEKANYCKKYKDFMKTDCACSCNKWCQLQRDLRSKGKTNDANASICN